MTYSLDDLKALQVDNPLLRSVEEEEDNVDEESIFITTLDGVCGDPVYRDELERLIALYNEANQPYKIIIIVPSRNS